MAYKRDAAHAIKNEFVYPQLAPGVNPVQPLKKILTLPSTTCGELKSMLAAGTIDLDTEIIGFEAKGKWYDEVVLAVAKLGFRKFTIYLGKIENNAWLIIKSHLECPFDLIFLDFCGNPTLPIDKFIRNISSVLKSTGVAVTFDTRIRYNKYLGEWWEKKKPNGFSFGTDEEFEQIAQEYNLPDDWKEHIYELSDYYSHLFLTCIGCLGGEYKPNSYIQYREDVPKAHVMLFFTFNMNGEYKTDGLEEESRSIVETLFAGYPYSCSAENIITDRNNRAAKATVISNLMSRYEAVASTGIKAHIKRIMNLVVSGKLSHENSRVNSIFA